MSTLQTSGNHSRGLGSLWQLARTAYSEYARDYLSLVSTQNNGQKSPKAPPKITTL